VVIAAQLALRNLSMGTEGLPSTFPLILFLYFCILVNLLLFVFNLVPLPFLDGGKILTTTSLQRREDLPEPQPLLHVGFFFLGGYVITSLFPRPHGLQ